MGARFVSPITDIKPLGSVSFFDANTNAPKVTFKDELESENLKNPLVIPVDANGNLPNIFFSGSASVIYLDQFDEQYAARNPVGEEIGLGNFTLWSDTVSYDINDIVKGSNGRFYVSLANGNQGNDPTLNPGTNESWKDVRLLGVWNSTFTYAIGDVVQTSDGKLWRALTATSNKDPATDSGLNWLNAINEAWVNKSTAFIVFAGKSYQIDASGGAVDAALQTSYVVGDQIIVHNESISTNTVRLTNTALTIKGKGSTATSADNIVIPAGETAILIAKTTTILESL